MELEDNRLLALAGPALKGIADAFEAVPLLQGQPIHEPMEPITRLYFLTGGMSSEIAIDSGGQRIEVGCVGYEGFAGVPAVLGVDWSPHRSFMETDGYAYVIDAQTMTVAARENALLMSVLHRYAHVFMMQIAATALADGRYNIEQRTARWLLMAHDRLAGDELPLTHDFLASARCSSVRDTAPIPRTP